MDEQVEAAALVIEGQLYLGENHLLAARAFFSQPGEAQKKIDLLRQAHPLYLTSRGRLVELEEAELLARDAGQTLLFGCLFLGEPSIQ